MTRHICGVISSQHQLQHFSLFCFCGDTHPIIVALWHFHADLNFLSALQIFKDMPVSGGGQGNSQLNLPRRRSTDSKAPSCSERPLTLFHTPSFSEKDKGTPASSFFIKLKIHVKLYFLSLKIVKNYASFLVKKKKKKKLYIYIYIRVVTVPKFQYSVPIPVKIHGSRYQFRYQSKTQKYAN